MLVLAVLLEEPGLSLGRFSRDSGHLALSLHSPRTSRKNSRTPSHPVAFPRTPSHPLAIPSHFPRTLLALSSELHSPTPSNLKLAGPTSRALAGRSPSKRHRRPPPRAAMGGNTRVCSRDSSSRFWLFAGLMAQLFHLHLLSHRPRIDHQQQQPIEWSNSGG
jgi:hypothetical protein